MSQSSSVAAPTGASPAGRASPLVAHELDPGVAQVREHAGQEPLGDAGIDQQRLGRVADARALDLGVVGDRAGHLKIGVLVNVDVAVARRGVHHRHGRHRLQRLLQTLAAPRDHQVHQALGGRQLGQLGAVSAVEQLDRPLGKPGFAHSLAHDCRQGPVGARGVARSPEHDRIAALQGERGAVHGHVRPRLVDDRDHAERHPDLLHPQAACEHALLDHLAHRVRQRRDVPHPRGHGRHPLLVERQPIAEGVVEPRSALVGEVRGVRLEDLVAALAEQLGEPRQSCVLRLGGGSRQLARGPLGRGADVGDRPGGCGHA